MTETSIAQRINDAITQNGGYQKVSDTTGISVSTLVRAAKGKTEPKLKDVIAICEATGVPLNFIAYGRIESSPLEKPLQEIQKGLSLMNEAILSDRLRELEQKIDRLNKNS